MPFFSKLFGGGAASKAEIQPVAHAGFRIYPEPIADGGQHRVAARIEKDVDGTTLRHHMIRADTLADPAAAVDASLAKARALIDQQGDAIFR